MLNRKTRHLRLGPLGVMGSLAAVAAAAATSRPASRPARALVVKTRTEVSLPLADANAPARPARYAVARVVRDGKPAKMPRGAKLDAATGALTWLPTESQAGTWDFEFLVTEPPPRLSSTAARRIEVQPREIATDRGKIGQLLRTWYAGGSAAGNTGDFYDNRDGGHSRLYTKRYPQLDKVVYPEEMKRRRLHWALQLHFLFPHVTLGNSSTASGDMAAGSNSRRALMRPRAADVLHRQYKANHLYVYPEHRDHDPGHNGRGGYGDLFPANIPYLITSQGSSGSDRPFLEAVAYTLAAFRPKVKKRLVETGLLMPTVQMIFRRSNKNVPQRADYLTGKAHPTAFEGGNVDALKMVRMAHGIEPNALPPMAQLSVVEEDQAVEGRDYFDTARSEKLFDTPAAIARVVRSTRCRRRIVLSARASYDVNDRALTYHWALLRGDRERVKIKRLDKAGSRVEIVVDHHDRRPVTPGATLESNRVDVGAFVHNGAHYSPPAFLSLFYLDDEARTCAEDGRVLEVGYGLGDSTIGYRTDRIRGGGYDIADWQGFFELLGGEKESFAARLLRRRLGPAALSAMAAAAKELKAAAGGEAAPKKAYDDAEQARKDARAAVEKAKKALADAQKAQAGVAKAQADLKAAEKKRGQADKNRNEARKRHQEAQKAAGQALTKNRPRIKASVKDRLERALNEIKDDVEFYFKNAEAVDKLAGAAKKPARKRAFTAARDELVTLGILADDGKGAFRLSPILPGEKPPARRLTTYERNRIEWFNIAILREVLYPGLLNLRYRRNYVNPLLATPKDWRDVYHYDSAGRMIGWTRRDAKGSKLFTADGALVEKKDKLGRALAARRVRYLVDRDARGRPRGLKYVTDENLLHYQYANDTDRVGRVREDK